MRQAVRGRSSRIVVVGIDAGMATMGVAAVSGELGGRASRFACEGLWFYATKKADKKLRRAIRVSTDDRTRIDELLDRCIRLVVGVRASAIALEWYQPTSSHSSLRGQEQRQSANGWKAALTVGGVLGIGRAIGVPVLEQLSLDRRKLGRDTDQPVASGGKQDVEDWLREHLAGFTGAIDAIAKSHREHPSDAAAHAVLAFAELAERRRAAAL